MIYTFAANITFFFSSRNSGPMISNLLNYCILKHFLNFLSNLLTKLEPLSMNAVNGTVAFIGDFMLFCLYSCNTI